VGRIRRLYLSLYQLVWGHLPPGTLVMYREALFNEAVGIVIGGWRYWKHPGFVHYGSVVVIGEGRHDLENDHLTVLR
jgi:hypothetical protein